MSILFVINSSTAPILFLKEFTFSTPIVTFLAFCNLCVVTDRRTSFSALSWAELFLLNDLLLSTFGLIGLSVLELFTFIFFYHFTLLFSYCFVLSSIHIIAKVTNKTRGTILIQMNSTFVQHTQTNVLVINRRQLPNSTFIL